MAPVPPNDGGLSSSLSTPLILQVSVPAFGLNAHVSVSLKPARADEVGDAVQQLLRSLADDCMDLVEHVDFEGSSSQLEILHLRASKQLDGWSNELKQAEEWKVKLERMKEQQKQMSNTYFKELCHLREQVYQQKKAKDSGKQFTASCATYFDPSDCEEKDELATRVAEKVAILQQEFEHKSAQRSMQFGARLDSVNQQLMASKMKVMMTEKLLRKVMSQHGYQDEEHVQQELGAVHVSVGEVQESIDKKMNTAEDKANKHFLRESKAHPKPDTDDSLIVKLFQGFLERKFGSLKQATTELYAKHGETSDIDLVDFQGILNELGYNCDGKALFTKLGKGTPICNLKTMLEVSQASIEAEYRQPKGRRSSSKPSSGKVDELGSIKEGELEHDSFGRQLSDSDPFARLDQLLRESDSSDDGSVSSRSSHSSISSNPSQARSSRRASCPGYGEGRRSSSTKKAKMPSSVASAAGKWKSKISGRAGRKKVDSSTMTDVTHGSRVDCGTEAKPYYVAYPKKSLCTRSSQSQIDGTMLNKAFEFFDKAADDAWNDMMGDEEEEDEDQFEAPQVSLHASKQFFNPRFVRGVTCESALPPVDYDRKLTAFDDVCRDLLEVLAYDKVTIRKDLDPDLAPMGNFFQIKPTLEQPAGQPSASGQQASRSQQVSKSPPVQTRSVDIQVGVARSPGQDVGTQASASMISQFEAWLPGDNDTHEVQLEKLLKMGHAIHEWLPEWRLHAEKMVLALLSVDSVSQSSAAREQELFELLQALQLDASAEAKETNVKTSSRRSGNGVGTLEDVLSRHGISTVDGNSGNSNLVRVDGDSANLQRRTDSKVTTRRSGRPGTQEGRRASCPSAYSLDNTHVAEALDPVLPTGTLILRQKTEPAPKVAPAAIEGSFSVASDMDSDADESSDARVSHSPDGRVSNSVGRISQKSETALPMKRVVGVIDKARRLSSSGVPSSSGSSASKKTPASLQPGWSGLTQEQIFVPLGVSSYREDDGDQMLRQQTEPFPKASPERMQRQQTEPSQGPLSSQMQRQQTEPNPEASRSILDESEARAALVASTTSIGFDGGLADTVRPGTSGQNPSTSRPSTQGRLQHSGVLARAKAQPVVKRKTSVGVRLSHTSHARPSRVSSVESEFSLNMSTPYLEGIECSADGPDGTIDPVAAPMEERVENFSEWSEWTSKDQRRRANAGTPRASESAPSIGQPNSLRSASSKASASCDLPVVASAAQRASAPSNTSEGSGDNRTAGGIRSTIQDLPETAIIAPPEGQSRTFGINTPLRRRSKELAREAPGGTARQKTIELPSEPTGGMARQRTEPVDLVLARQTGRLEPAAPINEEVARELPGSSAPPGVKRRLGSLARPNTIEPGNLALRSKDMPFEAPEDLPRQTTGGLPRRSFRRASKN